MAQLGPVERERRTRGNHSRNARADLLISVLYYETRQPRQAQPSSEVPFGKFFHNELFRTHSDTTAVNVTHTYTHRCQLVNVLSLTSQQTPVRPEILSQ